MPKDKNTPSVTNFMQFLRNPLRLLYLLLVIQAVFALAASAMRKTVDEPCGENLGKYLPDVSDTFIQLVQMQMQGDCRGAVAVPSEFNSVNAGAYAAEICFYSQQPACADITGSIKPPSAVAKYFIPTKKPDIFYVDEGKYSIVPKSSTVATAKIAFCVGVLLQHPDSPTVMLAHVNAENIQAYDKHLRQGEPNPFANLQTYLELYPSDEWQATLVSGSAANQGYLRAMLGEHGVKTFMQVVDSEWAMVTNPSHANKLNQGSLAFVHGRVGFVRNRSVVGEHIDLLSDDKKEASLPLVPHDNSLNIEELAAEEDQHYRCDASGYSAVK